MLDILKSLIKQALVGILLGSVLFLSGIHVYEYIKHKNGTQYSEVLYGPMTLESVRPIMFKMLAMPPGNILNLYIDSPGGEVRAMTAIETFAKITGTRIHAIVLDGAMAASAAAFVLQHADSHFIAPGAFIVFHTTSTCDNTGKNCRKDVATDPEAMHRFFASLASAMLEEAENQCFITHSERIKAEHGEDILLTGKHVNNTLNKCDK